MRTYFPANKIEFTGSPVRAKLVAALSSVAPATSASPRVLVVGGSQGARGVNELVMAAVKELAAKNAVPEILHQTGQPDLDRCVEHYRSLGVAERVQVQPFIEDMAAAYGAADVVIARAGAMTLAELAIAGRPAILIPLPTAADDHQTRNAGRFVQAGAALMLDQRTATGPDLAAMLTDLSIDASRRATMSIAMRTLARPQAAQAIVDRLEKLAG
jgi:UDP-N-acetylglucosamine--N-acetylmuramyl-(pentapeptide) pyrophosphoryl-undecaprenol N-acetylglucosamine transferase